jgi:hypothetical protein
MREVDLKKMLFLAGNQIFGCEIMTTSEARLINANNRGRRNLTSDGNNDRSVVH